MPPFMRAKHPVSGPYFHRLFTSARDFFLLEPWACLPGLHALRLDCPDLEIEGACAVVTGHWGWPPGLILLPSPAAYDQHFLALARSSDPSGPPYVPGLELLWLAFHPTHRLPASNRREALRWGWPVAAPEANPVVSCRGEDGVEREPTPSDVYRLVIAADLIGAFIRRQGPALSEAIWRRGSQRFELLEGVPAWITPRYETEPSFVWPEPRPPGFYLLQEPPRGTDRGRRKRRGSEQPPAAPDG
ncbi:MAG: hypothetical protein ACREMH_04145 [Gemmatimonadales bacterium]